MKTAAGPTGGRASSKTPPSGTVRTPARIVARSPTARWRQRNGSLVWEERGQHMTIQSRLRSARRLLLLAGAALAVTAGALAGAGPAVPVARAASSLPCDIYAAGGTPAWPRTARSAPCSRPTTGRSIRSSAPPTAPTSTSACWRPAGTPTPPRRSPSARTPPARSPSSTTRAQPQRPADLPRRLLDGPGPNGADVGANAMALPVTVGGHPAYGLSHPGRGLPQTTPRCGHRFPARGIYMVTSSNLQQRLLLRLRQRRDVDTPTTATRT